MKTVIVLLLLMAPSLFAQSQNQSYIYSVEETANAIEGFAINSTTGAIVAVPGTPFADAGGPVAASTNQAGTFLFVVNPGSNSVSVYGINSAGSLTEISGSPFSTGDGQQPSAIAVSTDNKSLYVGSNFSESSPNNGVLQTYSIAADGSLTLAMAQTTEPFPVGFVVSATGPFLYLAGFNHVDIYNTTSGLPVAAGSFPVPAEVTITGNNSFLFIGGSNGPGNPGGPGFLTTLQINPDGSLTQVAEFSTPPSDTISNLALAGNFLFTNFGTFVIGSDGTVTLSPHSTWNAAESIALAALTSGPFVFTGSQPDSNPPGLIYPFVLAQDGTLTNSEPPLLLQNRSTDLVIATTETVAVTNPAFVFQPAVFPFNPVPVGNSIVGLIQIFSTGSAPLDIASISISGDGVFTETNNCPAVLAPLAICSINLVFAPTSAKSFTANLNLVANVGGNVLITGTGIAVAPVPPTAGPTITATPASAAGSAGQAFAFMLTTANFGKAPTLMADCSKIPATTCMIQGATLSVQTSKPSSSTPATIFKLPSITLFEGLLTVAFGLFIIRKRAARLSLALACLGFLTACGGHTSGALPGNPGPVLNPGTPSGTFQIVISAAGTQTTATVMLTIQ
jgi:6-phosphogluconolactonase